MSALTTERVTLGSSDVQVSVMGIGAWAWGDRLVWGYKSGYSDSDLHAAFQATLDAGINLLDTAEMYGFGRSEKLIGQFMRESGQRPLIARACEETGTGSVDL